MLAVAGNKKLAKDEVEKFAGKGIQLCKYSDVFTFYEYHSLPIPRDQAKTIIENSKSAWLVDNVIKHNDKTKKPFNPAEFKGFADIFFASEDYESALTLYERAGAILSADDYKQKAEQILANIETIEGKRTSWSVGSLCPTIKSAYAYFSKASADEATKRMSNFANGLLDKPDFTRSGSNVEQFCKIYEMLKIPIPMDQALKAAKLAEKEDLDVLAAKLYASVGMVETAKRIGDKAIGSGTDRPNIYCAIKTFEAAGDEEGITMVEFIERNLRD